MLVLGIESSCDELGAAIYDGERGLVLSNVLRTQIELHTQYGGVVPELASRDHVRHVGTIIAKALADAGLSAQQIDGIAVTAGPGLIGSLLCGVEAAKGLALAVQKPLVGINHLEGHIAAAFLEPLPPVGPFVALIVSGGHTSLVRVESLGGPYLQLGATRDDAAGEAFDKVAKLLGLGYPGGAAIDRLAATGDRRRFVFPRAMPGRDNLDFSFSGLKTAASRMIRELATPPSGQTLADFCASFQEAIVENLLRKSFRAAVISDTRRLVLAGGVAANSRLRERAVERGRREKVEVLLPSRANCTDNAVMIACAGHAHLARGERDDLGVGCRPNWPLREVGA